MTTRAAINLLGSDGSIIDITSLGDSEITSRRESAGVYKVVGTLGMVPIPEGWGYVVNNVDSDKKVDIVYTTPELVIYVTKQGEPCDLSHSLTLHVLVNTLPEPPIVEAPPIPTLDPMLEAQAEHARLRKIADYMIAPLQDAVDIGEASEEDEAALLLWKRYRVALSKVSLQPTYPNLVLWPVPPLE